MVSLCCLKQEAYIRNRRVKAHLESISQSKGGMYCIRYFKRRVPSAVDWYAFAPAPRSQNKLQLQTLLLLKPPKPFWSMSMQRKCADPLLHRRSSLHTSTAEGICSETQKVRILAQSCQTSQLTIYIVYIYMGQTRSRERVRATL